MRTVYTLGLKRHSTGTTDAHGNVRDGWADPTDWHVYGIAPNATNADPEPLADRAAVTTGLSVLAPHDPLPGPLDRVVVDGEEWEVDGDVADYTRGPFGYEAGVVVALKRAEG